MNHAGMIPVLADPIADDADGSADGRYHLPFTFTMLGDWILTVTVTQADGSSFSRNLEVRAASDSISGDEVMPAQGDAGAELESHANTAMTIHNAMARPAPLVGGTGAVYFALHNNGGAPATLIGAESPAAGAIELHTTLNDNGVLRMRHLPEGIEIAPGESIELLPGAMHFMLIDLASALVEGDSLDLTLHFEGADDLAVTVPVVNMDDLPAEAEIEHNH
jgi:copper(I)-binding protein